MITREDGLMMDRYPRCMDELMINRQMGCLTLSVMTTDGKQWREPNMLGVDLT